jgi:hypothetical protein
MLLVLMSGNPLRNCTRGQHVQSASTLNTRLGGPRAPSAMCLPGEAAKEGFGFENERFTFPS